MTDGPRVSREKFAEVVSLWRNPTGMEDAIARAVSQEKDEGVEDWERYEETLRMKHSIRKRLNQVQRDHPYWESWKATPGD